MYQLTIQKSEPMTEEEKKDERDRARGFGNSSYDAPPFGTKVTKVLIVTLTEEEFQAVKRGVIETM